MKKFVAATTLAIVGLFLVTGGQATAAEPAVFDAGAASASINPDTPQYIGGYGYKGGPTTAVHDDLEVRAFIVGKGDQAAVFVSADLTGWFAAYTGDNLAPYGIDQTREKIAAKLADRGYNIDRDSVIVSTTHTHAAPAVVGIWGTPDEAYLKKVSDAAVTAADQAAADAKPSEIWTGVGSVRSFVWQNGQGTNHPDGFAVDEKLPIMWARQPDTGATNALYATVPNHADQFNGVYNGEFSADWPGYARRALDERNGGTSVLAQGTLGRQEPPGSVKTYDEVIPQGEYVANAIQRTMAKATPLTDDTISATERQMTAVADNEDLVLGMQLYNPPMGVCIDAFSICSIPRSKEQPYLTPGANPDDDPIIGTSVESVRIGDVLYSTNPGEAFPEVNDAIRNSVQGARHANVVGMAGDMLGYYYERSNYTDEQFGSSDFERFNVGPDLAQVNADLARQNAADLGFATTAQVVDAPFDSDVVDRPGVQWYPDVLESADPVINIYGSTTKSQDGTVPAPATIDWDFGDGTTGTTDNQERFDHTFPGPGSYDVTATVTGDNAKTRSWTDTITINPPLQVSASETARTYEAATLEVKHAAGGSGGLIAAQWTCQDGSKVNGLTVKCEATEAGTAEVSATDGAGNTVSAQVAVSKAPPKPVAKVKVVKVKPKSRTVRRGKAAKFKVKLKNSGNTEANKVKVCAEVPKKANKGLKAKPRCRKPGSIQPGKSKQVTLKLKTTRKAKKNTVVKVRVTSDNAGKANSKVKVKTRK